MKTLILALTLSYSFLASAAITIVSDLDDTIKITDAGHAADAAYNGVFATKVFAGMPEFLSEARNYSQELHVVTASPPVIASRVKATLNKNGIQWDSIILKGVTAGESKIEFKVNAIKRLLGQLEGEVVLMGDDVDHDPEVYDQLKKEYGDRILAVYIHVIRGRAVPASAQTYWTSFDLALREFLAGRMNLSGVEKVYTALMETPKLKRIFPSFAQCPTEGSPFEWQLQTNFNQRALGLTTKLNNFCLSQGGK